VCHSRLQTEKTGTICSGWRAEQLDDVEAAAEALALNPGRDQR
jgi:hypothetical protein